MEKAEKTLLSLLVAAIFILNISIPVVYAYVNRGMSDGSAAHCNFFCNLMPASDKDSRFFPCPHHAKEEARKKKLAALFECRIAPASCHDIPSAHSSSEVDPYILSKYPLSQDITVSFFDFKYPTVSSQNYISFLERPPAKHHS